MRRGLVLAIAGGTVLALTLASATALIDTARASGHAARVPAVTPAISPAISPDISAAISPAISPAITTASSPDDTRNNTPHRAPSSTSTAALSVAVTRAQVAEVPRRVNANGDIAAWQEASIGSQMNGLRLAEVNVDVGDRVKRGQQLAAFASDTLLADVARTQAALAEAEATAADAAANAQRAESLKTTGALSDMAIHQYLTVATTAKARVDAQRAMARSQKLRLAQARVLAPDDGIVSARHATVGAVAAPGQELFRLIRGGRLEWRAQVASADMAALEPGGTVRVRVDHGTVIEGRVRTVAPTVDPRTRNGVVYVDLPPTDKARAGMFAQGEFELGSAPGMTLPQSAVQLRDGFGYVLRVGPDSRVTEVKVGIGQRLRDRIEITHGLQETARVVAAGGNFLADGDTVKVLESLDHPAAPASANAAPPKTEAWAAPAPSP